MKVSLRDARSRLSQLIDRAMNGEEVILTRAGQPMVRLEPIPIRIEETPREGGQWRGRVWMAEDFDTLSDDIAEAFGMEPS